jgi:hypothetical protein
MSQLEQSLEDIKEKRTFFQRPDQLHKPLYVLTSVFNATRYRSRWKLYQDFVKMVAESGSPLYTVEVAFGQRDFAVTEAGNPRHLQLRTSSELWHKENALNQLTHLLPIDAEYIAFMDADTQPVRSDWADETLHQLQHFPVVQMWSEAEDLGPNFEGIQKHHSFVYSWMNGTLKPAKECGGYYYQPPKPIGEFIEGHPGFAHGWRRSALNHVGGLIQVGITGANDNSTMRGLIGDAEFSLHPKIKSSYRDIVMKWQEYALRYLNKNIGLVPGKLLHFHHGPKKSRKYWDRWKILVDNKFEPFDDLKLDSQGLYQLEVSNSRQEKLRDDLRAYFRQRNEDSPEV